MTRGSFFDDKDNLVAPFYQPWLASILMPITCPRIEAEAAILYDIETNKILFEKNIDQSLPIASLTKLVTAMVITEGGDLDQDLLYKMLMKSDNKAAKDLAQEDTVEKMNEIAADIGLEKTHFVEVTGLDPGNVSTAYEMLQLTKVSLNNKLIWQILGTQKYKNLENTNELLDLPEVIGGKTGYTDEAGQCLILVTDKLITVVLNASDRFIESKKLIDFYLNDSSQTFTKCGDN